MKSSLLLLLTTLVLSLAVSGCGPLPPPPPKPPGPPPAPVARSLQVTNSTTGGFLRIVPLIYTAQDVADPSSTYSKAKTRGTFQDQLRSPDPNEAFSGVPLEPGAVSAVVTLTPGQPTVSLLVVGLNPNGVTDGTTYAESTITLHDGLNAVTVTGTFGSPLTLTAH